MIADRDLVVETPEAMHALGVELAGTLAVGDLVVLTGPLGAGKTALARGIGEGLGVRGPITSPTFVLARTHPNPTGGPELVHADAYRLATALELDDLDLDLARSVVVVEWGAGLADALVDEWIEIVIERASGTEAMPGRAEGTGVERRDEDAPEPRRVAVRRRRAGLRPTETAAAET